LPMIFDDEKKPLDQDVSVQIPNQEAVIARPVDGKAGKGKTVEPREPKALTPDAAPRTDAQVTPPISTTAPAAQADAAKDAPAVKPDPKPEAKKEPKAEGKADAKAESKAAPKSETSSDAKAAPSKAEEARVKAILDGAIAKEAAAKEAAKESAAGFAVQIGAFATEDKIREAREKLGGAGFKSYTEKLDTKDGERTRVRAGPFASRDAAESARDKIRALGFSGAAVVAK